MDLLHANDRPGEYPASWYAETRAPFPACPPLGGSVRADVAVVGAGYMGLSAALHLAARGLSVVVLEAQRVGFGASGRNGGQVGSGQRRDQIWIERAVGREHARRLWDMAEEAKALVADLIARHDMPVRLHPGVAHACRSEAEVRAARELAAKLARDYGYARIEPLDRAGIRRLIGSRVFAGGEVDRGAGHLHPLNFAIGLARAAQAAGAVIHERSQVLTLAPGAGGTTTLRTARGEVAARHVIVAGNGYLGRLVPEYAARVMPINNFIVATEPLGARAAEILAEPVAVADSKFVVNYWRLSEDGRLLFGGGESYGWRFPDVRRTVLPPLLEVYPQLADVEITHAWGGTLAITMNRMPALLRPMPNVLAASACSGHGVAMATLTGRILAETVAGNAAGFDLLARIPQPRFPGGAALRWPLLVLAMTWYGLRDRLGL
jgi:gamma-glutamylputrescine oxidase